MHLETSKNRVRPPRKAPDMTYNTSIAKQNSNRQRSLLLAADLKNSVLVELDAGNPNRIAYSPYGHRSAQHEVKSQRGFNGDFHEAKHGWYLLGNGHRAFNPRLMRFHSPDRLSPFGKGGLNAYMYCGGEPVMNSDPTGRWAIKALVSPTPFIARRVLTATTKVVSEITKTIGSAVSQIASAAGSAKKAFLETFWFDTKALKKLGPPPPKFLQKKPPNRVFVTGRYPTLPSRHSKDSLPKHGGFNQPTSPAVRTNVSATQKMDHRDYLGKSPAEHTVLLDMHGTKVAILRTTT